MDLAGLSMEKEKLFIIWACGKMINLMDMASVFTQTTPTIPECGEEVKKKARENLSAPKVKSMKAAGKKETFKIERNFDLIHSYWTFIYKILQLYKKSNKINFILIL